MEESGIILTAHNKALEYREPASITHALIDSMIEELVAADWYHRRAEFAKEQGDWISALAWEHVAGEEIGHYKEFKHRKEELGKYLAGFPA